MPKKTNNPIITLIAKSLFYLPFTIIPLYLILAVFVGLIGLLNSSWEGYLPLLHARSLFEQILPYIIIIPLLLLFIFIVAIQIFTFLQNKFSKKEGVTSETINKPEVLSELDTTHTQSIGEILTKLVISEVVISFSLFFIISILQMDINFIFKITFLLMSFIFLILGISLLKTLISYAQNNKVKYVITSHNLQIIHGKDIEIYNWGVIRKDFYYKYNKSGKIDLNLYSLDSANYGNIVLTDIPKDSQFMTVIFAKINPELKADFDSLETSVYSDEVKKYYYPLLTFGMMLFGLFWIAFGIFMDYFLIVYLISHFNLQNLLLTMVFIFHFTGGILFCISGWSMFTDKGKVYITNSSIIFEGSRWLRIITWKGLGKYSRVSYSNFWDCILIIGSKGYFRSGHSIILRPDRIRLYGLKNPQRIIELITQYTKFQFKNKD